MRCQNPSEALALTRSIMTNTLIDGRLGLLSGEAHLGQHALSADLPGHGLRRAVLDRVSHGQDARELATDDV